MTDYRIRSVPRISSDTFHAILHDVGSPAAVVGEAAYIRIAARGVDPVLALAIFEHESTYGRYGAAVSRHSWGNLRTSPDYPSRGGFVAYPTWVDGADDAARLLAGPLYGGSAAYATARTFPARWAPAGDGQNNPATYGSALVGAIARYIELDRRRHPARPPAPSRAATITVHRGAVVRIYRLGPKGCIRSWIDHDRWTGPTSTAPASAPVHRDTCDRKSGAMTTLVTGGHFIGQVIRVGAAGVSLRE